MPQLLASILAGLAAFSLYGLATVLMKYGAASIASPRSILSTPEKRRQGMVWALGCLVNLAFVAMLTLALGLGHASVVSSMTGFGLVVMALGSYVILKERLTRIELVGMVVVVLGVAVVGYFGGSSALPGPPEGGFALRGLIVFEGLMLALSALATALALLLWRRRAGALIGGVAGVLGGASMLLQKVFIDPVMEDGVGGMEAVSMLAASAYLYLFIIVSMGSFVMLQVAYQFGRAVQVVPAMVSAMILVPILGGVMVFAEPVGAAQLLGTGAVVLGVVLLSAFEKPEETPAVEAPQPAEEVA